MNDDPSVNIKYIDHFFLFPCGMFKHNPCLVGQSCSHFEKDCFPKKPKKLAKLPKVIKSKNPKKLKVQKKYKEKKDIRPLIVENNGSKLKAEKPAKCWIVNANGRCGEFTCNDYLTCLNFADSKKWQGWKIQERHQQQGRLF
ncbi:MAG: hypothetical protein ACHQYP_05985 [Nitrospiria bacterium]